MRIYIKTVFMNRLQRFVWILLLLPFGLGALPTNSIHKIDDEAILWVSQEHDFGEMRMFDTQEHTFTFTNTSSQPVVILDVKGSCGCTAMQWTKVPILPGAKGDVLIKFNPWKDGIFNKTVTVFTNLGEQEQLIIKANVQGWETR